MLWGWNQEHRNKVDVYDYAGCLSLPRVLWLEHVGGQGSGSTDAPADGWALHQQPLPELSELRNPNRSWSLQDALPMGVSDLIVDGGAKVRGPLDWPGAGTIRYRAIGVRKLRPAVRAFKPFQ